LTSMTAKTNTTKKQASIFLNSSRLLYNGYGNQGAQA
jgi:hypothetical protein